MIFWDEGRGVFYPQAEFLSIAGIHMRRIANLLFGFLNLYLLMAVMEIGLAGGIFTALLITIPVTFITILAHELGHAYAVVRMGGQVHVIAVMMFQYDVRRRKFGTVANYRNREVGGFVEYDFEPYGASRHEELRVAAAGPAGNLLLSLGALVLIGMLAVPLNRPDDIPVIGPAHIEDVSPGAPTQRARGPVAALPDAAAFPDAAAVEAWAARDARTTMLRKLRAFAILIAIFSTGMGLINLLPFSGSDGEAIRRARRAW